MNRLIFPVSGPAKKSRNSISHFTAVAAFVALAVPASAQSISVTGIAPSANTVEVSETIAAPAGPPRSIVEPYKATAPRSRGPLALLVGEPQAPRIADVPTNKVIADQIAPAPTRSLPTITVSTLSVPSTPKN